MGKYFDKREGREKSLPDCAKHGLVWDEQSQRCEQRSGLGYVMDEMVLLDEGGYEGEYYDPYYNPVAYEEPIYIEPLSVGESMYTDDFGNVVEVGIYDEGSGGDSFAIDYAEVYAPTVEEYYGLPFEGFEPESFMPPFASEDLPFAPYEPVPLESPEFFPLPEAPGLSDQELFFDYLDFYIESGYDPSTAIALAGQDISGGSIVIPTEEQSPLPEPLSPVLPFVPFTPEPFIPEQFFPLPFVPEVIPPPPAPAKLGPCDTPSGLPGVCAQGFYHPLNSPCDCVPFPPAPSPTQTQQPKPPGSTPAPAPKLPAVQAPKPPTQPQPCPTTHCKHPTTGQCIPIPQGYARHPQTQICTALTAQAAPLPIPEEAGDLFANLKEIPLWVWVAGAGLLLLSQSGGDGERRTTITHRRA